MSQAIESYHFDQQAYQAFCSKLNVDLKALKMLLQQPGFGVGDSTIGAEVEFYIIDQQGLPLPINNQLIESVGSKLLQEEISRFSIELNLNPKKLKSQPFRDIEQEIDLNLSQLNNAAQKHNGQVVAIGILPTLKPEIFTTNNTMMTHSNRYKALANFLKSHRGGPFNINIDGAESLHFSVNEVTIAGATTSFQLHWRVNPDEFADYFNAVQLLTPIAVGISANSPMLFGRQLWDETRITLFGQATNCFVPQKNHWDHPAHVSFGEGWVRDGAWELFAEAAAVYPPALPVCDASENPIDEIKHGKIPRLSELCLHQGIRWMWNRAIYDASAGGHLRIEMRALPAGPSIIDQMANAAFLIGAANNLKDKIRDKIAMLPFRCAEHNFYQAAKYGFNASLTWPSLSDNTLKEFGLNQLAESLLPDVEAGLKKLDIDRFEINRLMRVLEDRIIKQINGAAWQRNALKYFNKKTYKNEACRLMLKAYQSQQQTGKPVAEWENFQ